MNRRDSLIVALAVLALVLCAAHLAHGAPNGRHRRHAPADLIATVSSRVHGMRWRTDADVEMVTVTGYEGPDQEDEILAFVEFSDGGIGIYLGRQKESEDEWLTLTKMEAHSAILADALKRSATR